MILRCLLFGLFFLFSQYLSAQEQSVEIRELSDAHRNMYLTDDIKTLNIPSAEEAEDFRKKLQKIAADPDSAYKHTRLGMDISLGEEGEGSWLTGSHLPQE
jgi:hypothetical protein